jgi:hypothetical protein
MAYDVLRQKSFLLNGARMEMGSEVTISGVSSQVFYVPTKLRKVIGGHGMMVTDGLTCLPTRGVVSGGLVKMTRIGSISTSADTVSYSLFGD